MASHGAQDEWQKKHKARAAEKSILILSYTVIHGAAPEAGRQIDDRWRCILSETEIATCGEHLICLLLTASGLPAPPSDILHSARQSGVGPTCGRSY